MRPSPRDRARFNFRDPPRAWWSFKLRKRPAQKEISINVSIYRCSIKVVELLEVIREWMKEGKTPFAALKATGGWLAAAERKRGQVPDYLRRWCCWLGGAMVRFHDALVFAPVWASPCLLGGPVAWVAKGWLPKEMGTFLSSGTFMEMESS